MQTATKYLIAVVSFILFVTGCRKQLRPEQYSKFFSDEASGMVKKAEVDGMTYTIQYRPAELVALTEVGTGGTDKPFDVRLSELRGTVRFNVALSRTDGSMSPLRYGASGLDEYNSRLNYFLTEAAGHFRLIYGDRDTLNQVGYLFENHYNLTPQETMVVGFALPSGIEIPERDLRLSYDDELFKNGIINVRFASGDLARLPELAN